MKHYKSVEILSILRVSSSPVQTQSPLIENFLATVLLSGPSPGYSSRGDKSQNGGAHLKKFEKCSTVLDVFSNWGAKRKIGATDFNWGGGQLSHLGKVCPLIASLFSMDARFGRQI